MGHQSRHQMRKLPPLQERKGKARWPLANGPPKQGQCTLIRRKEHQTRTCKASLLQYPHVLPCSRIHIKGDICLSEKTRDERRQWNREREGQRATTLSPQLQERRRRKGKADEK